MGNVVRLKLNHETDHFPLVARYRLEEGGPCYEMYLAYDKFVVVTRRPDEDPVEQIFEDSMEAGLLYWTQLITAMTNGTAFDLLFSPEGYKRLVCNTSLLASYVMTKRLTDAS